MCYSCLIEIIYSTPVARLYITFKVIAPSPRCKDIIKMHCTEATIIEPAKGQQ